MANCHDRAKTHDLHESKEYEQIAEHFLDCFVVSDLNRSIIILILFFIIRSFIR